MMGTFINTKQLVCVALLTLLVGCGGGGHELPTSSTVPMQQSPEQMNEIMSTLKELKSDVATLKQNQHASPVAQSDDSAAESKAPKLTLPGKQPVSSKTTAPKLATGVDKAPATTAPKADAKPAAKPEAKTDIKAQGRQLLDQVLQSITSVKGFDAVVNKHEVGIENGKVSDAKIRLTGASPHRVRIEILQHDTKKGLKVAYTGGASQINIRPNGVLSMISVSKPMSDPLVLSSNGQKPDEVDFYAMAKRLASPSYQAEVVGKSNLNGKVIHVLKVTNPGGNTLFSQISHEYIGFDPTNNQLLLWEAYSTNYQGGNTAFLRMSVDKFDSLSNITEQQFAI